MKLSSFSLRSFVAVAALSAFALTSSMAEAAQHDPQPHAITRADHKLNSTKQSVKLLRVIVDQGIPIRLSSPASSVFIANPDVADIQVLSPTSLMVFGKRTGETTLMATDEIGHSLLHRTVLVEQDLTDLRRALALVIPHHKIGAESVPDGIVLVGTTNDPAVVEDARRLAQRYLPKKGGDIINRIQVSGSNQIHLRVRFAEVSRDVDKRLGINWESIGNIGSMAFGIASGETVLSAASNILGMERPITNDDTNDIISFSAQGDGYNVNGMVDALAKDGFLTILAEPNLTAMSGETASFLAGGEFPVPIPQAGDNITIEWKQYGVSLAFTPTLVGGNRLNIHVRPEVSQLTDTGSVTLNNIVIPALTTRRADTTIEVASGQSFAIGGLLNNSQTQSINKYPFLGDLPILGNLFKSTRFQNNETELVILITPYIVKPVARRAMALPTDGFSAPTDVERVVGQRLTNSDKEARTMSGEPVAVPAVRAYQLPVIEENEAPAKTNINWLEPPLPSLPQAQAPSFEEEPTSYQKTILKKQAVKPVTKTIVNPEPSIVSQKTKMPVSAPVGPSGFILE